MCGYSLVVEYHASDLVARVRFSLPAPKCILVELLKNIDIKNYDKTVNAKLLKYMSISCIIIALITVIAGRYYLPFYIVAATFAFLSLIIYAFKSVTDEIFSDK